MENLTFKGMHYEATLEADRSPQVKKIHRKMGITCDECLFQRSNGDGPCLFKACPLFPFTQLTH